MLSSLINYLSSLGNHSYSAWVIHYALVPCKLYSSEGGEAKFNCFRINPLGNNLNHIIQGIIDRYKDGFSFIAGDKVNYDFKKSRVIMVKEGDSLLTSDNKPIKPRDIFIRFKPSSSINKISKKALGQAVENQFLTSIASHRGTDISKGMLV